MTSQVQVRDRAFGVALSLAAALVVGTLLFVLGDIVWSGLGALNWQYLTAEPSQMGRAGGILPILVSTFMIVGIAILAAMPIGLATALLLSEFTRRGSRLAFFVRKSLDVLAGIPSIVFGLFGNAFFCVYLGMGFSILSGGLTLACMVLPILIRVTEESLRAVPDRYRQGVLALGFSRSAAVWHIILPMAVPGLVVGTVLGFGRAIAETAALIFTSGYVDRMPSSALDSGRSLSVHIYDLAMNVPGGDRMAYGASLVLVMILVLISLLTGVIARRALQRQLRWQQ